MNIELLEEVEAVGSKLEKERLLKRADEQLQTFLEQCLDPDITYGITVPEAEPGERPSGGLSKKEFWAQMSQFLIRCSARDLTGNAAQDAMTSLLARAPDPVALKWACRLINKNLRAGFDIRTYTKVWGKERVQKFEVQLADTYEGQELKGLWFFQPKLDGNRVVLIDGRAMSRGGKEYPAAKPFVEAILRKEPKFFKKWVLDGEMMGNLGFDQSSGALRRVSQKDRQKADFTYWAFDIIDREEWRKQETRTLFYRDNDIRTVIPELDVPNIKLVPTYRISSPSHSYIMDLCDEFVKNGFEGAMAKDAESPYVFKRGANLLKVKKFFDADLRVVGFYEGKGKHKGRLGGIVVEGKIDGKPIKSDVGSGFDDSLREEIWQSQKKWLGAVAQVQYQGITPKNSLRFPVFVMRRRDKED